MMLTEDEEKFIEYWQHQRTRKKWTIKSTLGLPLGVLMIVLVFINLVSGWDERAMAVLRSNTSFIMVIIIACIGIVGFLTYFSSRFAWEEKEQQYKELLAKKERDNIATDSLP